MTSLAAYEEQCPGGQSSKTLQQEAFLEKEGETEKNEPENDQANAPKRHRFTEKVFLHQERTSFFPSALFARRLR